MQKQFVLPSVSLVPFGFVSLANFWVIACTNNLCFTPPEYADLANKLRVGMIPSLRVNSTGGTPGARRRGGQVYFNPKLATEQIVGKRVAEIIEKVSDLKLPPATCTSGEGKRQRQLLVEAYQVEVPVQESTPMPSAQVDIEFIEAVEVKPQSALTDEPNLAERLVAGIENVKGTNSEMLAAIRENTAVMSQLLACWQPRT